MRSKFTNIIGGVSKLFQDTVWLFDDSRLLTIGARKLKIGVNVHLNNMNFCIQIRSFSSHIIFDFFF